MSIGLKSYQLAKRIRDKMATCLIKSGFHGFGKRSVISLPFRSGMESRITVGDGVYIGHHCWFEVMSADEAKDGPVIRVEDGASFSGFCTITAVSSVIIGKGALIARYVHISDHTHRTAERDIPIKDQGVAGIRPVRIGEGAWIGQGVVICPGVTIGRNAVIGANSVVREDVPDFSVAAGAPARIVRRPEQKIPVLP
jgi:Acetyltransferase (isoleucine patch superfamily)